MSRTSSSSRIQNREKAFEQGKTGFDPKAAAAAVAAEKAGRPASTTVRSSSTRSASSSNKKEERNYYNAEKDEATIKRVEELAPYQDFAYHHLENVADIIARYREKGSFKDKSILVAIAYGGHCVMHLDGSDKVRLAVDIVRKKDRGVSIEARQLNYDVSRKAYLPLGQTTYPGTVNYLMKKLEGLKRNPDRIRDEAKRNEVIRANADVDAKAKAIMKEFDAIISNPPRRADDEKKMWEGLIGTICKELGFDAKKTADYQGLRDSYKYVVADTITDWIGTDSGKNGYKTVQEYVEEYLEKGYIEGLFNKNMLASDVRKRIEMGLISEADAISRAKSDPSLTMGYMIRSSVDGMPIKVYANRALRLVMNQSNRNEAFINGNNYTITDNELKSMCCGNLVTVYSQQGKPLTLMYDGFSSSIKEEEYCGLCLKAAHAAEHSQHLSVSQENDQEVDLGNDAAQDVNQDAGQEMDGGAEMA